MKLVNKVARHPGIQPDAGAPHAKVCL